MRTSGQPDDPARWKPKGFEDYFTIGEVSEIVSRDRSRIRRAESAGNIPAPIRVKIGRHRVRLYAPSEIPAIVRYFKHAKPGRPKGK